MHRADSFADYMKILVLLGTAGALYMSINPLVKDDINKPELPPNFARSRRHDADDFC